MQSTNKPVTVMYKTASGIFAAYQHESCRGRRVECKHPSQNIPFYLVQKWKYHKRISKSKK